MRFIYSKIFAWFVGVLIFVVLFLFLQTRGWVGPMQRIMLAIPGPIVRFTKSLVIPFRNGVHALYAIRETVKENADLRARIVSLEQQLVDANTYRNENEHLRRELGFVAKFSHPLESCTVLSEDPEGITDLAIISCGEAKQIKPGQGVISGGYLIGKVLFVTSSTSTVRMLTSPDTPIDAKVSGNSTSGLVKGSFGSGILMDLIPQNAELQKGDLVVTAGINESIPKDVLIGQVGDTISGDNDLFKKVTITSPVDFKNLQYVFVIKK